MTEPTLHIHVGPPKTGTTALQQFMRHNAGALAARGLYWPRTGTERVSFNHVNLVEAFSRPPHAAPLLARLAAELAAAGTPSHVLISAEHFAPRIAAAAYFASLEAHCRKLGYRPHIIAHLRPQAALINSHYTQMAKNLRAVPDMASFVAAELELVRFDYPRLLGPAWNSAAATVTLRPYSRAVLDRGLVGDFLAALAVPGLEASAFADPPESNVSPGPRTIAALIDLRARALAEFPSLTDDDLRAFSTPVIAAAGALGWNQERYFGLDADEQARIERHYAEGNELAARRAWGRGWREVFDAADWAPRPLNVFDRATAAPAVRTEYDAFIADALQLIRDSRAD